MKMTPAEDEEDGEETGAVKPSIGWEITQPDGSVKIFNAYGLLVTEKDRKGYKTSYVYDSAYQLRQIITPSGKILRLHRMMTGRLPISHFRMAGQSTMNLMTRITLFP